MKLKYLNMYLVSAILTLFICWGFFIFFIVSLHAETLDTRIVVPSSNELVIDQNIIYNYINPSTGG